MCRKENKETLLATTRLVEKVTSNSAVVTIDEEDERINDGIDLVGIGVRDQKDDGNDRTENKRRDINYE